ncbi:B3 domain-containing transcription factor VRN1 isoform X2 [Morus notabilis]|uniref:B3 domain-containing transcription factor VRN1 isoform X2 n=1 Tax=Morus notabilis TaxID=981085 RepID=UPI000CED2B3E|nr:B3 domain-containing transcription factor VRN1 isoform X2 [Morus notabilis]
MQRLPRKFVSLYGDTLSRVVFLIPPCGSEWRLHLEKKDGKVWLQRGWPEFVKHYAIGVGHLLFFRYKGSSKFEVSVCDISNCEVDEPDASGPKKGEIDVDGNTIKMLESSDDDDSVHIIEHLSSQEEYLQPSSPPHKRMGTSGKASKEKSATKRGGAAEARGKHRSYRHSKAFKAASKIFSEKPIFVATVTRIHNTRLPATFVQRHIEQRSPMVTLKVESRSWYVRFLSCKTGYFLGKGYCRFLRENSISLGDVCAYELNEKNAQGEVVLKVSIFRQAEY